MTACSSRGRIPDCGRRLLVVALLQHLVLHGEDRVDVPWQQAHRPHGGLLLRGLLRPLGLGGVAWRACAGRRGVVRRSSCVRLGGGLRKLRRLRLLCGLGLGSALGVRLEQPLEVVLPLVHPLQREDPVQHGPLNRRERHLRPHHVRAGVQLAAGHAHGDVLRGRGAAEPAEVQAWELAVGVRKRMGDRNALSAARIEDKVVPEHGHNILEPGEVFFLRAGELLLPPLVLLHPVDH
mmetsp:Transcript_67688/g.218656  ORF Transcript_67688/g.218656 Transcript_67688/m.218656 type:complete len:236 (+) Transcript_67688:790-1497(+)